MTGAPHLPAGVARWRAAALLALLLALVVGGLTWPRREDPPAGPPPVRFAAGEWLRYRLEVEAVQRLEGLFPGLPPLEGRTSLAAVVRLAVAGREGDRQLLALQVEALERGALAAAGQVVEGAALEAAARRGTAWLEVAPSGRITGEAASEEANAALVAVASAVRAALQLDTGPGGAQAWTARERGLAGELEVRYAPGPGPGRFSKRLEVYRTFDALPGRAGLPGEVVGGGATRLDPRGFPAEAEVAERLELAGAPAAGGGERWISLTLLGAAPLAEPVPRPAAGAFAAAAGELTGEALRRRELARLAREMPAARVRELLDYLALTGKNPPDPDWLHAAAARLALEPELLPEVAAAFRARAASHLLRTRLTELLVAAGTPEAQRLLVELLRPLEAARDATDAGCLQRAGLTARPGPELAGLVEARLGRELARLESGGPADPTADAVLLAAGSVASRLALAGSPADAEPLVRPVVERLGQAGARGEQLLMLGALGNAGAAAALPALSTLLGSPDAEVRAAAADAARAIPGPEARELLQRAAADASPRVQDRALLALDALELSAPEVTRLAEIATRGGLTLEAQHRFLVLASRRLDPAAPGLAEALEWIAAHGAAEERERAAFLRGAVR